MIRTTEGFRRYAGGKVCYQSHMNVRQQRTADVAVQTEIYGDSLTGDSRRGWEQQRRRRMRFEGSEGRSNKLSRSRDLDALVSSFAKRQP